MAIQPQNSCALPEGLRYYLLRGTVMVPLVPVDQLPSQLQGIPRQLTHRQMSDDGWKFLAETGEPPSAILVQAPTAMFPSQPAPAKPRFLAPDHHARLKSQSAHEDSSRPDRLSVPSLIAEHLTEHLPRSTIPPLPERPSSLTDTFASIYQKDAQRLGYRMPYHSGIEPDPSRKEYCTHWIKTGECAFISIGCKYKHEMPTVEKLRELGFTQGMPKWWKEKSSIAARGQTWMQRRLAQGNDDEAEMPALRAFPDPLTFRTRQFEERMLPNHDTQHSRGILRKEAAAVPANTTRSTARSTAPSAPFQAAQRASQMPDLLIDLDETPAPPPSPQPSDSSSASSAAFAAQISSSRSSASSLPLPVIECGPNFIVDSTASNEPKKEQQKEKKPKRIRRHYQISSASNSDDEVKPVKPSPRRKAPRKAAKQPAGPAKQRGLASSKYAASNNTLAKNVDNQGRNANRKMTQQNATQIGAPELHAKTEQVRRGRDAHQKERTRKGTTHAVGEARGDPATLVPLK